jgi:hypothetical protein
MHETDKRIIRLIAHLIFQKEISSTRDFCVNVTMLEQTISKIKNGSAHFTVLQIGKICKIFKVNANWIYGIEKNVFNTPESVEISSV